MKASHRTALDLAVQRAHQSYLRQQQAARHCVGGETRRRQLYESAERAKAHWEDLAEAVETLCQAAAR